MLTTLLSAKAAAAAFAAVAAAGTAAAAYTGNLPAPVQQFAHDTIDAPAPQAGADASTPTDPTASATPVGPDATGPAAFGLCTAWEHAQAHGTASQDSTAFQNLAAAASAAGSPDVATFCQSVPHPGTTPPGQASSHATGKPATPPGQASTHPTGKPSTPPGQASTHPTGKPDSAPTHS